MSEDELNKILKSRAEKLVSLNHDDVALNDGIMECIQFMLGKESYAIESRFIREVYPLNELTSLPCVPRFVAGIVNIRRKIVSVIDLKQIFDLPDSEEITKNKIMVLHYKEMEFAIIVDSIVGAMTIESEQLQNDLPTVTGIRYQVLKGITTDRLIVLDGEKLLMEQSLLVNESLE